MRTFHLPISYHTEYAANHRPGFGGRAPLEGESWALQGCSRNYNSLSTRPVNVFFGNGLDLDEVIELPGGHRNHPAGPVTQTLTLDSGQTVVNFLQLIVFGLFLLLLPSLQNQAYPTDPIYAVERLIQAVLHCLDPVRIEFWGPVAALC